MGKDYEVTVRVVGAELNHRGGFSAMSKMMTKTNMLSLRTFGSERCEGSLLKR